MQIFNVAVLTLNKNEILKYKTEQLDSFYSLKVEELSNVA